MAQPRDTASCPLSGRPNDSATIAVDDELVLTFRKRMVIQRGVSAAGAPTLHLFYGHKEISFDEPELFGFGEALAAQERFRAMDAASWGAGHDWGTVRPLLEQLLQAGVIQRATVDPARPPEPGSMLRPSPLPPAVCRRSRTWAECEAITADLTGVPVELGYLELIVPVFRVAHPALDLDGRQVGEANVFPRALRLETPTTWVACAYPGTRHMIERPMNVTALKAMRLHWRQMMAALAIIREAYLRRYPESAGAWTVGRVERLATMVLAVPTHQLVRHDRTPGSQPLHPALSSLFRVTDGLRMTMHQMLFVPIGEPTRSPDAPLTSAEIFDYAERNYSFHSETGVCGGPQHMIREFLRVLIDGEGAPDTTSFVFDAPVAAALDDVDAAFDYGLRGLQVYAAFFSFWPAMARAYEHILDVAEAAVSAGADIFVALRDRFRTSVEGMKSGTYLATEEWRSHRERVYADMYEECGRGLSVVHAGPTLPALLAPTREDARAARELTRVLEHHFGRSSEVRPHIDALHRVLMAFFLRAQAIFRVACDVQQRLNDELGRPAPRRPFGTVEADVHNRLQGVDARRLPYLIDELRTALDIDIAIDTCRLDVRPRRDAHAGVR